MAAREVPKITTFDVPPDHWNAAAASDEDLTRYGFPKRPADPRQRERYDRLLAELRGMKVVTAEVELHPEGLPGLRSTLRFADNAAWCGAVVSPPQGDSLDWVLGEWTVPHVGVPTDDQSYYCANWVGIGGFHPDSDVCQAGIASKSSVGSGDSINAGPVDLYAWVEWVPAQSVTISNFVVDVGDAITIIVVPDGAASTTASVLYVNRSRSTVTSLAIGKPGGAKWRADSAEWIVERPESGPSVNPSLTQLADFGTLTFEVADSGTHSGFSLGAGTGKTLNMFDDRGRIIARASLPGPTIVRCTYVNPWVGWSQIRSGVFSDLTPVGAAADGSDIDLYAVGQDGPVYTSWWRGGPHWSNWIRVRPTTFPQLTPIAALARGSGRDLYAVHDDSRVYTAWWRGGPHWSGWAPIGHRQFAPGTRVSALARGGDIDLYAVATDGRVYSAWWRGGPNWGGWATIGSGVFAPSTPVTAVLREDEIHLFAVGLDGAVYSAWWRQAGGWHDWKSIGFGTFTQTTPIAAAVRGKDIDLFGVGMDGHVLTAWLNVP